jgi:ParB/RepB/Spo0J family partition protein
MQQPITKLIRFTLLDEPDVAARIEISDDGIRELAASIAATGLIYPLCVVAENGRFRIYAGHRRYLAIKQLGWDEVECRDYTNTGIPPEQIKFHENMYRAEMTDGEWVEYVQKLREQPGMDLEQMMRLTGKSENWLADRLAIFRGHEVVYRAMIAGTLNISQAKVLNRFPPEYVEMYLMHAIERGTPARVLESQLREFNLMNLPTNVPEGSPPIVQPEALPGVEGPEPCMLCGERHSAWTMKWRLMHQGCIDTVLRAIKEAGG